MSRFIRCPECGGEIENNRCIECGAIVNEECDE